MRGGLLSRQHMFTCDSSLVPDQVEAGYAGLRDVTVAPPTNDNTMQSFWLAETLKYTWLLFAPNTTIRWGR